MSSVAIVGGGIAGLAAATALAASGHKVALFERKPYLGGRASSYEHPATGETVDNCQHVLLGCCTNLIDFYSRIGSANDVRWFNTLTFITPDGVRSELRPGGLPAPLHSSASFLKARFLSPTDKFAIARALATMMPAPLDDVGGSFLDWLKHNGQTEQAIRRFWEPVLVSALNEDLDRVSVKYASLVFRDSFLKSPSAGAMGVPSVPLTELYSRAADFIRNNGGEVHLRTSVENFRLEGERVTLDLGLSATSETFIADDLIVATPWHATAKLLERSNVAEKTRDLIAALASIESSPITGVHLWFDRTITDLPHAVLLDRTIQWMFHKSMLQPQRSDQGSYVEVVVSASKLLVSRSRQEIIDIAMGELAEFFPAVREAKLRKATVVKELHATYSVLPSGDKLRPAQATTVPHLFLAGDWTRTEWPATMEGAVRSGYLAAEAVTRSRGDAQRFLVRDLPARGFMQLFR